MRALLGHRLALVGLVWSLSGLGCGRRPAGEQAPVAPAAELPPGTSTSGGPPPTGGTVDSPPVEPPPSPPPQEPPPPLSGFPPPPEHFVFPPLQETVEEYRVNMAPELLATFSEDVDSPPQPAEFIAPDGTRHQVMMRLRGNSTRGLPKRPWRIEFPEGTRFDGRRKLNLLAGYRDQTFIDKLGFDILEAMGVPASRAKFVRLVINDEYQGVYLDVERVDTHFLRNHGFVDTDATIWRCAHKDCEMKTWFDPDYQKDWEQKTNEETPRPELADFLRLVNHTPEPQFLQALSERFELEHHLRSMAMDILISNTKMEDSRSYVIYDAITRRYSYAPWDLNNSETRMTATGSRNYPYFDYPLFSFSLFDPRTETAYLEREAKEPGRYRPLFSNLNTRILQQPALRERILALTEQALAELFAPAVFDARMDATWALLAPHNPGSPWDPPEKFAVAPGYMKEYAAKRTAFLRAEIAKARSWKPTLVLQTVDPQQGFVELTNLGTAPVDTTGMVLTTNLRETEGSPAAKQLPSRSLAPGETLRVDVALAPEGEVGVFDGKSVVGVLDALYYGQLPPGQRYARSAAEPLRWEVR